MSPYGKNSRTLLSLPPHWFHILLSLADGPLHGLAITRDVYERTEGRIHLWPGALYGALKSLAQSQMVKETEPPPDFVSEGGNPRFYRITPAGRRACAMEAVRLERYVEDARRKRLIKRPV